jgi:hypothetical protein
MHAHVHDMPARSIIMKSTSAEHWHMILLFLLCFVWIALRNHCADSLVVAVSHGVLDQGRVLVVVGGVDRHANVRACNKCRCFLALIPGSINRQGS